MWILDTKQNKTKQKQPLIVWSLRTILVGQANALFILQTDNGSKGKKKVVISDSNNVGE